MCYWTNIILVNFYLNIPLSFNKSFLPHIGWLLWYSPHPAGLSAPYKVYKKRFRQQKSEKKQKLKNNTNISYFRCDICKSKLDTKFPVPVPTARFEEF